MQRPQQLASQTLRLILGRRQPARQGGFRADSARLRTSELVLEVRRGAAGACTDAVNKILFREAAGPLAGRPRHRCSQPGREVVLDTR